MSLSDTERRELDALDLDGLRAAAQTLILAALRFCGVEEE